MRIRLEIGDDTLREALAELLGSRGHEVVVGTTPGGTERLVIRSEPGGAPRGAGVALLSLRPGDGGAVDADPRAALARALERGGEARWQPPLDARLLLDALEPHAQPLAAPLEPLDPALRGSCEAWWLLHVPQRSLLDASGAAWRMGVAPGAAFDAVGRLPWADQLDLVWRQPEGRLATGARGGEPGFLVWWTPRVGRRLVGWFAAVRPGQAEGASGDLHALAELGRVSGTFAHEVRNPLASLASALDLLRRDLEPAERAEVASMAQARLEHMRTLLDDTLRLVRPFRDPAAPVDLETVVASAVGLARADPLFAGVALDVEAQEPWPWVRGHAEPLRQALTNLLVNAAHAQGARGTIHVRVQRRSGRVVLCVKDEGPGIAQDLRERVFEPFWTTKTTGTGLGLAYVRRVAEACGGSAQALPVSSGALIELDLPEAEASGT